MFEDEFHWPRPEDALFLDGDNWTSATVGIDPDSWDRYAIGYTRAAELLCQHLNRDPRLIEYLVYPIVFLYRHAFEVYLKHIILMGAQLERDDGRQEVKRTHKLSQLWQEARVLIERVWPDGPKEDLDKIGELLHQFEERDPAATAFRYPVTTAGEPSHNRMERISIANFEEVATNVISLLEATSGAFDDYLYEMKCHQEHF